MIDLNNYKLTNIKEHKDLFIADIDLSDLNKDSVIMHLEEDDIFTYKDKKYRLLKTKHPLTETTYEADGKQWAKGIPAMRITATTELKTERFIIIEVNIPISENISSQRAKQLVANFISDYTNYFNLTDNKIKIKPIYIPVRQPIKEGYLNVVFDSNTSYESIEYDTVITILKSIYDTFIHLTNEIQYVEKKEESIPKQVFSIKERFKILFKGQL